MNEFDAPNEILFNFSEIFPLQTLAATKLALLLWRDKICIQTENRDVAKLRQMFTSPSGVKIFKFSFLEWNLSKKSYSRIMSEEFRCRELIDVPTQIADLIDERIVSCGNELQNWLEKLKVFYPEILEKGKSSIYKIIEMFSIFFDNIVLNADCTICLKGTVVGILTSTEIEITPTTKYRMACEYCLENWVRELWPLVNNNIDVLGRSPMVLYWNAVMMDEFNDESRDYGWIFSISSRNWAAVEYFWDRWCNDEQTTRAIDVLQTDDFHVMKFLWPKLNQMQAERVCVEIGHYILCKMIEKDEYFEYAEKFWIYMKDIIPGNVFLRIIHQLWMIVFNPSKSNLARVKRNNALLLEVWTTAPNPLKRFVLDRNNFVRLFENLDDEVRSFDTYNLEVLLTVMANADYGSRRIAWLENWRKLVIRAKASKLAAIVILCLPNDEEIERFKEHKMANFEEMETYFSSWVTHGFFAELNEYLNFCVKNPRRLENLSKEIIMTNLQLILFSDGKKLDEFFAFAHSTFRDSQSVTKFTNELLSTPECLGVIYCKLDEGRFDEVISISTRFPTSEKNLSEMKREFLEYCNRNFARGQITGFVKQKFENFLAWCSLNETTTNDFKQSLNADDIFDIIVNKRIEEGLTYSYTSRTLPDFKNFLEWYFGSSETAKVYKSTKVIHYKESELLKKAFENGDSQFVDQFLRWACDDDTNKIAIVREHWRNGSV